MPANQPLFSNQNTTRRQQPERRADDFWKILIADDEQSVHDVTVLALKKFSFIGKGLQFLHAYSGDEATEILKQHDDIAIILLDVVMESDDAGLTVARYIREQLNNKFVRIVLRTGQPGSAPEADVIQNYDINDYKDKTELTVQKLHTVIYASLRSYRDIISIEQSRTGLERVIESTSDLFKTYEFDQFVSGLLIQIASVTSPHRQTLAEGASSFLAGCEQYSSNQHLPRILTGSGRFSNCHGKQLEDVLREKDAELVRQAIQQKTHCSRNGNNVYYFENKNGRYGIVFLANSQPLDEIGQQLMDLFTKNISIAYDNISLYQEIEETQHEVILTLGTIAEFRSKETSEHVNRVALYSEILALNAGLPAAEAKMIRLASPMHDIGKIGIPDKVLHKPDKLTEEEFEIIKSHCQIGYDMLKNSTRPILKTAAIIALEHQEKWDGSGYPQAKSGKDIHIYGRITAVADVFDALGSDRCYKKAWELNRILDYFRKQRGKHFDPELIDILLDNLNEFLDVRDQFRIN